MHVSVYCSKTIGEEVLVHLPRHLEHKTCKTFWAGQRGLVPLLFGKDIGIRLLGNCSKTCFMFCEFYT